MGNPRVSPQARAQLEDFNARDWWDHFLRELDKEVDRIKGELGKATATKTLEEVRYLQGRKDGLEHWVRGFAEREIQRIIAAAQQRSESSGG